MTDRLLSVLILLQGIVAGNGNDINSFVNILRVKGVKGYTIHPRYYGVPPSLRQLPYSQNIATRSITTDYSEEESGASPLSASIKHEYIKSSAYGIKEDQLAPIKNLYKLRARNAAKPNLHITARLRSRNYSQPIPLAMFQNKDKREVLHNNNAGYYNTNYENTPLKNEHYYIDSSKDFSEQLKADRGKIINQGVSSIPYKKYINPGNLHKFNRQYNNNQSISNVLPTNIFIAESSGKQSGRARSQPPAELLKAVTRGHTQYLGTLNKNTLLSGISADNESRQVFISLGINNGPLEAIPQACSIAKTPARINPLVKLMHATGLREEFDHKTPRCKFTTSKFRTYDGSCNNVFNTSWGAAGQKLNRIFERNSVGYPDNMGFKVNNIANPRMISEGYGGFAPLRTPYSSYFYSFYRFLSHDLVQVTSDSSCLCTDITSTECIIIPLAVTDTISIDEKCIPLGRFAHTIDRTRVRQFINAQSAYIDLSQLYGVSQEEANTRRGSDGKLRVSLYNNSEVLPLQIDNTLRACEESSFCSCYIYRGANEGADIADIYYMYLKLHNFFATLIKSKYPDLSNEQVFQESRRINIGLYQHHVFDEFLPVLFGRKQFDQLLGKYKGYQYSNEPSLTVEFFHIFSALSYRFYNQRVISNDDLLAIDSTEVNETSFDPEFSLLYPGAILRALISTQGNGYIDGYSQSLRESWLKLKSRGILSKVQQALDQLTISIARTNDLGLLSYQRYEREASDKLEKIFDISSPRLDSGDPVKQKAINLLRVELENRNESIKLARKRIVALYASIENVDALTGILTEDVLGDSLIPKTALWMFSEAFNKLRNGDRYHYENTVAYSDMERDLINKINSNVAFCLAIGHQADIVQDNVFLSKNSFTPSQVNRCLDLTKDIQFNSFLDTI